MAHSSFTGTSVTLREVAVDCPLVADTTILPTHGWFEEKRKKRRKKEIIYFFSFFPFFAKKREGRGKKREQVFLFFSQLLFRSARGSNSGFTLSRFILSPPLLVLQWL